MFDAAGEGCTILAPNAELATALFDAVERMHVAAGHEIWPTPHIRDFGGWLRERHVQRQLRDASLPRCLNDIEERELWRSVIRADAAGAGFLEPSGAAHGARRARRTMVEHGIPLSALAAYPTDEAQALVRWNRRFEEHCRDLDCIAADQLLVHAPPAAERLAWIETPMWRPAARTWLEAAGAVMLPPGETAPAPPARRRASSPDAELAAIADWCRFNLRDSPKFRAWVCIPDLALRRARTVDAFDAALAPQRFSLLARDAPAPYAVAGGTSLADFAPVRAALGSLSAAEGVIGFEAYSSLLRMPELQSSAAGASAAAALDLALRTRGPSEATLHDWLTLSARLLQTGSPVAVDAVARLQRLVQVLDAAAGRHPLSRWVAVWVEALQAGPWAERHRWSSTEFQAAERFRELLGSLATGDSMFGERSAASAVRLLQRAARDTAFQAQTGIPPIWVSGQAMDPWLTYDGIWIAGCSEERWPPPPDPVPLIPVRLQRDHGVLSAGAEGQLQLAAELQARWRLRAPMGVYSCADPGDGRSTHLSALVPAGPVSQDHTGPTRPHWHAMAALAPTFERLADDRAPAFAATERTRGVATLRAQSLCPFRGFAATRLAAEELTRPSPGFSRSERGIMVHDALELIWSELRTSARLAAIEPARRESLLEASVAQAIRKQCERRDPGPRWRRREAPRLLMVLDKWLQLEQLREPFEVESLEQGAETARHGGLEFNVRIDRRDRLVSDGARVLIDYKTGAVAADWRGERPDNPQLPIYALLHPEDLVAVAYGKVDAGECTFVAEAARGGIFKARGRPSHLEGQPTFGALLGLWSRRIESLAAEFATGHAAVAPSAHACEGCGLQPLCRIPSALAPDAQDS